MHEACSKCADKSELVIAKLNRRILPFLFLLYATSYIDRANLSFAKVQMAEDLGFSEAVYGFGAGVFFLGYFLLEIPGALIAEKWSARLWISRILVSWGLCTVCEAFVRTRSEFYLARFCLGLAEAGFFPAVLVYLTHWFPKQNRARALSGFIVSVPLAFVIGAPLSAACLSLQWFGTAGWRWLFILQGAPAILLGIIAPIYLQDDPTRAHWLTEDERAWLLETLNGQANPCSKLTRDAVYDALRSKTVWLLAGGLFLVVLATYGYIFWLPSIIEHRQGVSTMMATLLSAVPFCAAAAVVIGMGRMADAESKYRLFASVPLVLAGAFFAFSSFNEQPFAVTFIWLVLTGAVLWAWAPSFWAIPSFALPGPAAAASLGIINSLGNLGGFVGPTLVGAILTRGHSYAFVVRLLSIVFVCAALLIALVPSVMTTARLHSTE